MISSRDQRRIYLLPRRPDQTRNPGLQDISTMVKQDQQSLLLCRQIPIGAAHISFSGHTGLSKLPVGQPRVAPRGHRRLTGWTNTHNEHWPGGDNNIKMTLESTTPKGKKGLGEANVKPRLGLAGGVLFKANCQGGPINHPTA